MLTIKKSYPFNRKYVVGSIAFIVGYAGILSALSIIPQRVANDSLVQLASESAKVQPQQTETTSEATGTQTPAQRTTTNNTPVVTIPAMQTEPTTTGTPTTPEAEVPTTPTETTPPVETPPIEVPELPIDLPLPDPTPEAPESEDSGLLGGLGINLGIEVKL